MESTLPPTYQEGILPCLSPPHQQLPNLAALLPSHHCHCCGCPLLLIMLLIEWPPPLPTRRKQLPDKELLLQVLPSPRLLWSTGSAVQMRPQPQQRKDQKHPLLLFYCLALHLLLQLPIVGLNIGVWYPFALIALEIFLGWVCRPPKKLAAFFAQPTT